jgi:hypothetical protein
MHHLDSDPQLNAWRWSTTEHDRLVAVAHPQPDTISSYRAGAGWSCSASPRRTAGRVTRTVG